MYIGFYLKDLCVFMYIHYLWKIIMQENPLYVIREYIYSEIIQNYTYIDKIIRV